MFRVYTLVYIYMFLDKHKLKELNMKKIVTLSLVAATATTMAFGSTASDLRSMKAEIAALKAEVSTLKGQDKKITKKLNAVKAHDANDNIKWGADLRTSIDNINYDMADGDTRSNSDLMSMRLLLNMAYAPDNHNIFKGQLSMNKAFGADFGDFDTNRAFGMGTLFDWTGNAALGDNHLKVSEAYWLYLGDKAFGLDMPWTFSVGRRPSGTGFLAHLRDDDAPSSPLAHVINVEFDGLSSKLDLSNLTGVPGMSFKICMGRGSTNATPLFADGTPYAENNGLTDVDLAGFIFEPYNDGQFIVKTTAYRAFDLPGYDPQSVFAIIDADDSTNPVFSQVGDMDGAAISVLVDGLADDGYLADAKVFGSFAWSKTRPDADAQMLGMPMMTSQGLMNFGAEPGESKTGTSYWFGAQLPVTEKGKFGVEYNHGSQYWRPFTYAEDTMIGSKLAARGDAFETYFTYQLTDALSAQVRYTKIDYDYTGSNAFFASGGTPIKISDLKNGEFGQAAAGWDQMSQAAGETLDPNDATDVATVATMLGGNQAQAAGMAQAKSFMSNVIESAQDVRFYLRYRF